MGIISRRARSGRIALRHATLIRNLPNIERHGLLCEKSQGKKAVVWLHAASYSAWSMAHVVRRHGGRIEAVVILEVQIPRSWLRRSRKGLWYSVRDIPADRIRKVITFTDVAGASAA
jgi:hypothetical protein